MVALYEIEKPEPKKNKVPKSDSYRAPRETQRKPQAVSKSKKLVSTKGMITPSTGVSIPVINGGLRIWVE